MQDPEDVHETPEVVPEVKGHKRGRTKKGEAQSQTKEAIAKRLSRAKKQAKEFELLTPEQRFKKRLEAQQDVWENNRESLSPEEEAKLNREIADYNDAIEFLEAGLRVMRHNEMEEGFSWPEAFCAIEDYIKSHPLRDDNFVFSDTLLDSPQISARDFSARERRFGLPSTIPSGPYQDVCYEFSKWLHVHHNELKHASPEIWEATDKAIRESKFGFLRNWRHENKPIPAPVVPPKLQRMVAKDGYEEHLSPEEAAYYSTHTFRSPAEQLAHNAIQKAVHQQDNSNLVKQVQQLNQPANQRPNESKTLPQAMQKPVARPMAQSAQPEDPTTTLLKQLVFLKMVEHMRDKK